MNNLDGPKELQKKHTFSPGKRFFFSLAILLILLSSFIAPVIQKPILAVNAPSLQTPVNGSTITATGSGESAQPPVAIPEFRWSAVKDATSYRLQISQDIAFSVKFEFTTPMTRFTPPSVANFNDGLWYWRVRVEAPIAGDYSEIWSFTRQWASLDNYPALISPGDGESLEFFDAPTFSWAPVIGAAWYRIQIATASDFSALVYNQTTLATTHQPALKLANGTFYWRVIPLDSRSREGTYSEFRSFYISYNQIPELLEPEDNSFPTFTPTFRWKAVRGAQYYKLQYSTDPTFNTETTTIDTRNTTYTPLVPLANDKNYYWRVRTYSGSSISEWSEVWSFIKKWYIRPVLLTPVNNYQDVRLPYYTWSPVPGASYYRFELDTEQDFVNPYIAEDTSNNFYTPYKYEGTGKIYYWRITPYDANKKPGKESVVSSYYSDYTAVAPDLIYPYYYYTPNNFPAPDQNVAMQPHVDRTVARPVFYWHRLTTPPPSGETYAHAYRLQVCSDPLFDPADILWTVDTENTHAAPTISNPFTPVAGQDYFWRVRALNDVSDEIGEWSQIWKTRIDLSLELTPKTNNAPQLLRPAHGTEIVEATPLLEWWPKNGADQYEVQISDDPAFASQLDTATVPYPVYSPTVSLAQRFLGRTDYGSFYWRVRARSGGNPLGSWSEVRRFQIASQSERVASRTLGDPANQLLIASDPDDIADNNFELTTLHAAQDTNFWYFGLNATVAAENMTYALYLDLDHQDGSGATSDARGYTVTTIPAHQPEFAIYINQVSSSFSASQTSVYAWNGSDWNSPQLLSSIGGELSWDSGEGYVEIKVPNTAIGMQDDTGSYAVSLFSLPSGSGTVQDAVPSEPLGMGNGPLSRFASVSEKLNPVLPANHTVGEPIAFPFVPPFNWDYPTGADGASPWAGARMRIYLDPAFTTQVAEFIVKSNTAYYSSLDHHWPNDLEGDNTYYWRVQPCYLSNCSFYGAWSEGWRFDRKGFIPTNLQESVTFATPSFSWDIVEGAQNYDLQVDTDPNFGSPDISTRTAQNSYTHTNTLNNGTYYWRVRITRYPNNDVVNEWSPKEVFTLTLPTPQGLTPNDADPNHAIHTTPTFCWDPLIVSSNSVPVLAAYKYRLQVSKGDPTFSAIYEQVETEQACWTPTKGYDDGTYYWRVAMLDGSNKLGGYSPAAVFTKQYPVALPASPTDGAKLDKTPTFVWTAGDGVTPYVFGAASYKLEVSQFSTFSPIYESVTTDNTRYTPPKTYEIGRTYYWRVAIVDKDGKVGPFSDAWIIVDPNEGKEKVLLPLVQR